MHRRRWLKLGLGAAALLALGGGAVALLDPGLRGGRLTAVGRSIFGAIAAAVLDGVLPQEAAPREPALRAVVDRVDGVVQALPAHAQEELSQLLALLATSAGRRSLAGLRVDWQRASMPELQAALDDMRTSSLALRQQAFQALHDICGAAFCADRAGWTALGYPGPMEV